MKKEKIEQLKELGLDEKDGFDKSRLDVLKGMDKDLWVFMRSVVRAQEVRSTNENMYKLMVLSEQGRMNFERTKIEIRSMLPIILKRYDVLKQNQVELLKGETEQFDPQTGKTYSMNDIEVFVLDAKADLDKYINNLRVLMTRLYTHVGSKGLDMEDYFTDADWTKEFEYVQDVLKDTPYSLLGGKGEAPLAVLG